VNKYKRNTLRLTKGALKDAKGGINYEKPELIDFNSNRVKGDCGNGSINKGGIDDWCSDGSVNTGELCSKGLAIIEPH